MNIVSDLHKHKILAAGRICQGKNYGMLALFFSFLWTAVKDAVTGRILNQLDF